MKREKKKMLKIAICDDEKLFCEYLKELVEKYMNNKGEHCVVNQFASGIDFVNQGGKMAEYKIVFLDINMEELDGLETAKRLRELCEDTFVIFVTAFINYTLDGYKVNAFRYLLKNADNFNDNFEECMNAIMKKMQVKPECFEFDFVGGKRKVYLGKIMYIESNLHKVIFYIMEDGVVQYSINKETLNHIEQEIQSSLLIRIHQSFLVNLSFVRGIEKQVIVLADGTRLPIAKSKYKEVVESVTIYKGVF